MSSLVEKRAPTFPLKCLSRPTRNPHNSKNDWMRYDRLFYLSSKADTSFVIQICLTDFRLMMKTAFFGDSFGLNVRAFVADFDNWHV